MPFFADFHIHSKYSRATSSFMDVDNLSKFAKVKGVSVLGCGDFTHKLWLDELKRKLKIEERGLYKFNDIYFILTNEVANIYPKFGKTRKIHNIIFAPNFNIVDRINKELEKYGNLLSDGRPILSISSEDLLKLVLNISTDCLIIPAHIWTPWFSLFGSNSGFDTIEECFGEYTKYIYALETGLSSDPAMNWRLSSLDKFCLLSNSDSHSPNKIGREANLFECEIDYYEIINAIKRKDKSKINSTIEFFPQEGKYHYDGHRKCNISFSPILSRRYKNICPVCNSPLTIGVMHRVEELSDRDVGFIPENSISFKNLVPLDEIISQAINKDVTTQVVENEYQKLTGKLGSELDILLKLDISEMENLVPERILTGIMKAREGKIKITPGFDGVYGKIKIFDDEDKEKQMSLF